MKMTISTGEEVLEIERDGTVVGEIRFRPSDMRFIEKLHVFQEKVREIKPVTSPDMSIEDAITEAKRVDHELRSLVDGVFDSPVSDIVFGSSYAQTTVNGVPLVEQLLQAVLGIVEKSMKQESDNAKKRKAKYLNRYRK